MKIDKHQIYHHTKDHYCDDFVGVFNHYHRQLFHFIFGFVKVKEDAEELVQEIFLKLWERREKLSEIESIDNYIFQSARNAIATNFRKKQTEIKYIDRMKHVMEASETSPADLINFKELSEVVKGILDSLPDSRREIYYLNRFEEMSNADIAKRLGIKKKTVENQINLAQKKIRADLKKYNYPVSFFLTFFC